MSGDKESIPASELLARIKESDATVRFFAHQTLLARAKVAELQIRMLAYRERGLSDSVVDADLEVAQAMVDVWLQLFNEWVEGQAADLRAERH